ncbi:putative reverse transcriptase domain-containing protein [Tanacetum coccineum]|uniref:Reverse transcriptase domain-containing protein n=1 Tax=Tanacetum coccineum TaxID=301880 RepID=A0ABQ5H440_9ASTR
MCLVMRSQSRHRFLQFIYLSLTLSPGCVADFDPEEDDEEDHAHYPADGGDDDDESSDDDDDNDNDEEEEQEALEEDEDKKEEHLAPVDSTSLPAIDLVSSAEDTEAFETDESTPTPPRPYRARMSIRPHTPPSPSVEALFSRFMAALALPSPPPSPLTSLSSPLSQIPLPPLPLPSPTVASPTYAEAPLGYKAAMIWLRAASPPTHHPSEIPSPPLSLPAPSSPLLLPTTDRRDDIPEADLPPRKRLCLTAPTPRYEVGESLVVAVARQPGLDVAIEIALTTVEGLSQRMTDLSTILARDTHEIYVRLEDAQESEARHAREAWSHFINYSKAVHAELQAYRAQTQLTSSLGRIQILEARETEPTRDPEPQDGPADADSSCIADAMAEHDAIRSKNGDDSHDSGTGVRRQVLVARECTYTDFLKYQQLNFKGNALTWWNSYVKTVGHEVAYAMTWKTLKKMMADKYCLRGEIKKLEIELWNLKVKGTDVLSYNQCFQELALMCGRMFPEELNEVEKYVDGLLDMIQGSVIASKPKKMQDAIEFATELMDQKIRTLVERQAENKRNFDDTSKNNQNHQ